MVDYNFRYRSKQTNLKRHKTVRATSEVEARKLSSRKLRKFSRSSLSRRETIKMLRSLGAKQETGLTIAAASKQIQALLDSGREVEGEILVLNLAVAVSGGAESGNKIFRLVKQPSGLGEDRPNHFQRAQIDGTTFAIGNRSLAWMIEPPSHGLKPRAVAHRRKSAAKVSSDDFRLLVQEVDCPNKIRQQKPAVLPVGDCIAISKAIQVYGHINCRGPDRLYESCKSRLPIRS